jgi:hypothetical protein
LSTVDTTAKKKTKNEQVAKMEEMLPDEACHTQLNRSAISVWRLIQGDHSGDVILHNTMRFDVQLAYVQPMLDEGYFQQNTLVEAIRSAVIKAVEDVVGSSIDEKGMQFHPVVMEVRKSKMLHRETISFDLS